MRIALALALIAAAGVATRVHAEPPTNPRDAFGFDHHPEPKQVDCSDGLSFGCTSATDPLAEATPYALSTWLSADYLLQLPTGDSTHDQVASYAMGASFDDAGVAFGGATGLENRWTINGAPSDDPILGGVGTRVPITFLDGMLVTAGGFSARDRTSTGGTIDAQLLRGTSDHVVHARVYFQDTASPEQPPTVANSYLPRTLEAAAGPVLSASVVATGPIADVLGGHAWYAAGVAAQLHFTDFTWHASRLVDDGSGVPVGFPGVLATVPIETTSTNVATYAVPFMARAGLDRGANHLDLTVVGSVRSGAFFLEDSTLQAAGVNSLDVDTDAIATWHGEWHDTRAKLQFAWHHQAHTESARDRAAADEPQLLTAYIPTMLAEDPVIAAACNQPLASIPVCPVPAGFFASAGAGELVDQTADRWTVTGDLSHRFGGHVARIGGTVEETRVITTERYTGNEIDRSLFPGELSQQQFIDPTTVCTLDVNQPCTTTDSATQRWPTVYAAAYAEDTWSPMPGLSVDGGLRWELMWLGTVMHLSDELAPRLGVSWERELDALTRVGGGRIRAFAGMGRSFALVPAGLGAAVLPGVQTVQTITSAAGVGRVIDPGAPLAIAPGIDAMAQDEAVAGVDVEAARAVRIRLWLQARQLERGFGITTRGLDNPGKTDDVPPAARDTELVAYEISTAPTAKTVLRAGYSYGAANGTSTFAYDPRRGALLYTGDDYTASLANIYGRLPSDSGHRVYVEAIRRGTLGPVAVAVATRFTVASGLPRDVLGESVFGDVQLLPRGSGGRGEMISQANLRLAARWRGFDVTVDIFNLLDRQAATQVDTVYASDSLQPVVGGTAADLVFLKNASGAVPARSAAYGVPTEFQSPLSAVLGVHRSL